MKSQKKRGLGSPKLASSHRGASPGAGKAAATNSAVVGSSAARAGAQPVAGSTKSSQAANLPAAKPTTTRAAAQQLVPRELSILIGDLDAGGRAYKFPLRRAWLLGVLEGHEAMPSAEDGEFSVRVSKSGDDVAAVGRIAASLTAPCARCQDPTVFSVTSDFSVLFVPASAIADPRGDYEFSAGESDLIAYDGDELVFDDFVRDELVLETPMIPLCSEDCEGMKPNVFEVGAADSSSALRAGIRLSTSHADPAHASSGRALSGQAKESGQRSSLDGVNDRSPNDPKRASHAAADSKPLDPRLAPLLKFQLKKPS